MAGLKLEKKPGLKLGGGPGVKLPAKPQKPVFDSLLGAYPAERTPDPLAELREIATVTIEDDATDEVSAIAQAIADEKILRRDAYRTMVDPEFWFAVCFQNREQKEAFLKAVGWFAHGDKYLDGLWVARKLGIQIEPILLEAKPIRAAPKLLRDTEVIDG
jgi:hypothetical protein